MIEQIFSSIEELVDGKLVCGAGGGGFLQVILKKGVTRQMVEERLKYLRNNGCNGSTGNSHPVNNTVKYIDKLRGHRRDGKLEHQSAYGCLAKICCCVHFNFPHPFDRDCRTCMCSSPCILIIVNFNRYGQKKL